MNAKPLALLLFAALRFLPLAQLGRWVRGPTAARPVLALLLPASAPGPGVAGVEAGVPGWGGVGWDVALVEGRSGEDEA